MSERNLNFEQGVDRKGTRCLKYDFAVERGKPADVLPLKKCRYPSAMGCRYGF